LLTSERRDAFAGSCFFGGLSTLRYGITSLSLSFRAPPSPIMMMRKHAPPEEKALEIENE